MQDRPSSTELAAGLRRLIAEEIAPAAEEATAEALARCERLECGRSRPGDAAALSDELGELIAELPRELRFRARVGAGVAALLEREEAAGEEPVRAEGARLSGLLEREAQTDPDAVRGLQAELAAELRAGGLDDRLEEVATVMREGLAERLAIARPGWTEVTDDGHG